MEVLFYFVPSLIPFPSPFPSPPLSFSFRCSSISSSRSISPFFCSNCLIWFSSLFWLLSPIKHKCYYILNYRKLKEGKIQDISYPMGQWFKSGILAPTEVMEGTFSTLSSLPTWGEEKTLSTLSTPSGHFVWWKMSILPRVGIVFLLTSKNLWKQVSSQTNTLLSSSLVSDAVQVISQQLGKISFSSLSRSSALSIPSYWRGLGTSWLKSKFIWNWSRRN